MDGQSERIEAMDVLRGVAVLGIIFGNVIGFGLPVAASLHPFVPSHQGPLDLAVWTVSLLLIDGKMRGLFALLFGASMLLMLERAAMDDRDGATMHRARMLTLIPIGVAHYVLLYQGDILMLLAVAGLLMLPLVNREPLSLLKWAAAFLATQLAINIAAVIPPFVLRARAAVDAGALADWQAYMAALGLDGETGMTEGLADRLSHLPVAWLDLLLFALPETLGFMALGMAMLKGGFLAAQWPAEQFRQTARHGYRIGLIGTGLLAAWVLLSRDALIGQAITLAASLPFRVPLVVAHAAVVMAVVASTAHSGLRVHLAAVGRMALSNYLVSSVLLAALFAPWGAGEFGQLGRAELWLIALAVGGTILLWSPLWLRKWPQGPMEFAWRRASQLLVKS